MVGLKTAWELAMEKAKKMGEDDLPSLSPDQKKEIAEVRKVYEAKFAELEILVQDKEKKDLELDRLFMVQELLGRVFPPIARTGSWTSTLVTSGLIVGAWAYFLYQGVLDPLGGINSLWPLFGISNQILASVALVVATTILIKMGRTRYVWVTLVPTAGLVTVTLTGSWQKVFHEDSRLGLLAQARVLEQQIADGRVPEVKVADTRRVVFNNRLDAAVTGFLALLILALLVEAGVEWHRILTRRKPALLTETPYVRTKWAEGSP